MDGEAAPASNVRVMSSIGRRTLSEWTSKWLRAQCFIKTISRYLYFENVTNNHDLAYFTFHCQALYAWMEKQPQLVMQAVEVISILRM